MAREALLKAISHFENVNNENENKVETQKKRVYKTPRPSPSVNSPTRPLYGKRWPYPEYRLRAWNRLRSFTPGQYTKVQNRVRNLVTHQEPDMVPGEVGKYAVHYPQKNEVHLFKSQEASKYHFYGNMLNRSNGDTYYTYHRPTGPGGKLNPTGKIIDFRKYRTLPSGLTTARDFDPVLDRVPGNPRIYPRKGAPQQAPMVRDTNVRPSYTINPQAKIIEH